MDVLETSPRAMDTILTRADAWRMVAEQPQAVVRCKRRNRSRCTTHGTTESNRKWRPGRTRLFRYSPLPRSPNFVFGRPTCGRAPTNYAWCEPECRLAVLVARNCWCLGWRSVIPGVMFLVWFAPRLWLLVRTCAYVFTLVLLFLLYLLVMRDVSCVGHVDSGVNAQATLASSRIA